MRRPSNLGNLITAFCIIILGTVVLAVVSNKIDVARETGYLTGAALTIAISIKFLLAIGMLVFAFSVAYNKIRVKVITQNKKDLKEEDPDEIGKANPEDDILTFSGLMGSIILFSTFMFLGAINSRYNIGMHEQFVNGVNSAMVVVANSLSYLFIKLYSIGERNQIFCIILFGLLIGYWIVRTFYLFFKKEIYDNFIRRIISDFKRFKLKRLRKSDKKGGKAKHSYEGKVKPMTKNDTNTT